MPHRSSDDARNVVLNDMNKPFDAYALSDEAMAKWDKVIEAPRRRQRRAGDRPRRQAHRQAAGGRTSPYITGAAPDANSVVGSGTNFPGLTVEVREATGGKCERCWMHSAKVGAESGSPTPRSAPAAPPWSASCRSSEKPVFPAGPPFWAALLFADSSPPAAEPGPGAFRPREPGAGREKAACRTF
jgi:hypothetical protein